MIQLGLHFLFGVFIGIILGIIICLILIDKRKIKIKEVEQSEEILMGN